LEYNWTSRKEGTSMADDATDTAETSEKKGGFLRKLMKIAIIGAIVAAAVQFFRRRKGDDLDDVEWQELPPPAGG
jgi:hypothetical protein